MTTLETVLEALEEANGMLIVAGADQADRMNIISAQALLREAMKDKVLVPREPTEQLITALHEGALSSQYKFWCPETGYRAMIAATEEDDG